MCKPQWQMLCQFNCQFYMCKTSMADALVDAMSIQLPVLQCVKPQWQMLW